MMMDGYHLIIGNSHVVILHICVTVDSCIANRLSMVYIKHLMCGVMGKPQNFSLHNEYSHIETS